MKIAVCIKEVFNSDDVKIDKETKNIDRTGAEMVINPYDLNAVELALNLKEKFNAETFVLTMGIPSAELSLRECLAMGIDNALLITDKALAGSDTIATSLVLAEIIKKYIPDCSLIICGKNAIDAETSIIGPAIAERMGIPQLTYIDELIELNDESIIIKKEFKGNDILVKSLLPAVISVTGQINKPRYMNMNKIKKAVNFQIATVNIIDLGLNAKVVGIQGSPTVVGEMHMGKSNQIACEFLTDDIKESSKKIAEIVSEAIKNI